MTYTLFFDGGRSSGIVLGHYDDHTPWRLLKAWQVGGGADGLNKWFDEHSQDSERFIPGFLDWGWEWFDVIEIAAEKWIPYPTPGHSPTLDSTYPLVTEGVLIALGLMPDEHPHPAWTRSSDQYFAGGSGVAQKKKLRQQWLKKNNLWLTGSDVGQKDADDAISALSHQLVIMKKKRHMPTLEAYFKEED